MDSVCPKPYLLYSSLYNCLFLVLSISLFVNNLASMVDTVCPQSYILYSLIYIIVCLWFSLFPDLSITSLLWHHLILGLLYSVCSV